jgi:hypothetical protein
MTKVLLVTRPTYDPITSYLHYFSKDLMTLIKTMPNMHVTDLEGTDVTRKTFEDQISKDKPGLVILNGHGNRDLVCGHKQDPILDKANIHIMKGKIVYALSCESLQELGESAVEKGAKAYVGYMAQFMLIHDPSRVATPEKDNIALQFKKPCVTLMTALVFGNTVQESINKTKEEYANAIRYYGNSEDDYGYAPLIGFALAWNYQFLNMVGDPEAKF